jgi:hypothetical protein
MTTRASRSLRVLAAIAALGGLAGCGRAEAPANTMPSLDRHTARYFPVNAGSTHATAGCNDCHGAFATFAQYDCVNCHTGPHSDQATLTTAHGAVAGFAFVSTECVRCHPDGTAAGVNHAAKFPIGAGSKHAGVTCGQCHTDVAHRADTATLACASCHDGRDAGLAGKHTGASIPVTDYADASPACLKCHADSQVNAAASHPRGDSTPYGESEHRTAGCTTCHKYFRADKAWAVDWSRIPSTRSQCTPCHQ